MKTPQELRQKHKMTMQYVEQHQWQRVRLTKFTQRLWQLLSVASCRLGPDLKSLSRRVRGWSKSRQCLASPRFSEQVASARKIADREWPESLRYKGSRNCKSEWRQGHLPIRLMLLACVAVLPTSAQQPVQFQHQKHIALTMGCIDCHVTAESGSAATLPSIRRCMACHELDASDNPALKRLAEFAKQRQEVPWVRIYKFGPSAFVKFQHAPHALAGIECSRCHGDVATMSVAQLAVEHNMGTCLSCHRDNNASDDCSVCHF